jgi:hypothetical protein
MIAAGIWAHPADRRLTVVLVRADGSRPPPLRVARTDAARAGLVHYLLAVGRDVHVAVADSVAEQDSIAGHLRGTTLTGWLVPDSLLDAVASAAGRGPGATRSRAAILARLPTVAAFRPMLRRIPAPDPRQLTLVS